ncbi:hypothetical protein [Jiangella asiatica]|uniref:DUF998 domain-containing protein n=1 Tax=Jiangella asiatica TaxID=2530372 RepID=A0A4R5CRA8_9ACTN|nr:hypothetical protein [Jiangella asiatica]TDE03079.1 hypothetical protein E1269_20690 [Jiangella asiatica]
MTINAIRTVPAVAVRRAGLICLAAGMLGSAVGIFLIMYPGQVPEDTYSYPLPTGGFAVVQIVLFAQHLGLAVGLLALRSTGVLGVGRAGRWGWGVAVFAMLVLAATELYGISAADAAYPSSRTAPLDALYAISSTLIAVGLIAAGVAVARAGVWSGWRRWIVLATGAYVLVPMMPALMAPFVVARLAIGVWMLLFAALGLALIQDQGAEKEDR